MQNLDLAAVLASFTLAEFRAFKKAQVTLWRAGLSSQETIEILVNARAKREQYRAEERMRVAR